MVLLRSIKPLENFRVLIYVQSGCWKFPESYFGFQAFNIEAASCRLAEAFANHTPGGSQPLLLFLASSIATRLQIESLETPEYAKAVLTIEATYWVNNMKTANAEFERVTELKNEIVSQTNTLLLSECKGAMIRYLNPLLIYINLMADVEPAAYSTANAKISEAVESITTVARSVSPDTQRKPAGRRRSLKRAATD